MDDLLFCGEEGALCKALQAVESKWSCAAAEWASESKALKFCGMEITADKDGNGLHLAQSGYEKELLERWQTEQGSEYPNFKICEADFETVEKVDPNILKEAQALAGGLLWLSTRTRPDVAYGVATMSRLMSKNPQRALEVGHALLRYIKANPGDLHYFKEIPNDGWGERNHLKLQRSHRSLEIFSDIAYAAGTGHRSVQGIAVFFGGSPVGWQSSQQAFVTHSTAESELVAYCESLLIGRAAEALLCAMWGEPLNSNSLSRVIYGDNLAAIGLANGTTCSSWRTRHLRIRAAILREAIEETGSVPGGAWRLLHLKGSELVADGLTKQLNGQAFFRFVEDLGVKRSTAAKSDELQMEHANGPLGGGDAHTAMKAIMVGSLWVSSAKAMDEEDAEKDDLTPIFVAGAVLMALGAVYAGQLMYEVSQCCLRRLRAPRDDAVPNDLRSGNENVMEEMYVSPSRRSGSRGQAGSGSMSTASLRATSRSGTGGTSSLNMPSRSGTAGASSLNMPSRSGTAGASSLNMPSRSGTAGASSLNMPSRSGTAGASSLNMPTRSGSKAMVSGSTSKGMTSQSGKSSGSYGEAAGPATLILTSRSGFEASSSSDCAAGGSTSMSPKTRSGSSGAVGTISQGILRRSGSHVVHNVDAAKAAEFESTAQASDAVHDADSVGVGQPERLIQNPWNAFQHRHKDKGLTSTVMSKLYKKEKTKPL